MQHFRCDPFAVESCGYMGKAAVRLIGQLGDMASAIGRISNASLCSGRCGCCLRRCSGVMLRRIGSRRL